MLAKTEKKFLDGEPKMTKQFWFENSKIPQNGQISVFSKFDHF